MTKKLVTIAIVFAFLGIAEPAKSASDTLSPIMSMSVSVPVEEIDQFIACLENYAGDHGYSFVAAVKNPVQGSILVEMKNKIFGISAYNPFFRSKYRMHFHNLSGKSVHTPTIEDAFRGVSVQLTHCGFESLPSGQ